MEHSELILIALILLIVFTGFQAQKLIALFRNRTKAEEMPVPVRTVVKAAPQEAATIKAPRKVAKKATAKKPATKKSSAKKAATKKAPVKKTTRK